jgi:hypothetical protein
VIVRVQAPHGEHPCYDQEPPHHDYIGDTPALGEERSADDWGLL